MLEIKKEEIKKLPEFKHNVYWGPEGTLYKILRLVPTAKRENFYTYVNSLQNIPGLILPIDLLKDQTIYGYQLPYIEGSQNIDEILKNPYKHMDIIATIKSMFEAIESIIQYLILCDVRGSNILIKDDKAYFIDWDSGKKLSSSELLPICYCVAVNKRIIPDSQICDILKTLLSALSIYYGIDMEEYFANKDLTILLEILKSIKANPNLIYFLDYILEKAKADDTTVDLKFSEIIDFVDLPSPKEKERLVRKLPH